MSGRDDARQGRSGRGVGFAGRVVAGLTIGHANDPAEHEADALSVLMLAGHAVRPQRTAPMVTRSCASCSDDTLLTAGASCPDCGTPTVRRAAAGSDVHGGRPAPAEIGSVVARPGRALDPLARRLFESRLGIGLGDVRVHDDSAADEAAHSVSAQAFTVGRHIGFAEGAYRPGTPAGLGLLGHELVHVAQNAGEATTVRRACSHDGTPTNCHNWLLPLPPWIAGSIAHQQIAVTLGIPFGTIPRGTKAWPPAVPTISFTPPGFADLWSNQPANVAIGEIKSTQTGSAAATAEAGHYMNRHNEWLGRLPARPLDRQDSLYLGLVGGPKPTVPLDLSGRTGKGLPIGPFVGDPGKVLNIEADPFGAVVYWCTGTGLANPAWLLAFKAALDALRKQWQALKRQMVELIDGTLEGIADGARWVLQKLGAAGHWISEHWGTIILVLLAILLVVLIIVFWAQILAALAFAAGAVAAAGTQIAAVVSLAAAATAILLYLGIDIPDFPDSTRAAAAALRPDAADPGVAGSSYDPPHDTQPTSASVAAQVAAVADPGSRLLAALGPLGDATTLTDAAMAAAHGKINEPALKAAMQRGISALGQAGDANGAALVGKKMRDAGVG
ncbi:eCIS core domain-containing protein [Sphingomonas bacterium]|uniref:eCIS core domain-containing protein n=1 Tax=Sphingomonas bacterium TaxID=1895847 RepID=UPI001C2DBBF1|nr:DUF4157 domain-containing protein [Sphingomonas bacterium]